VTAAVTEAGSFLSIFRFFEAKPRFRANSFCVAIRTERRYTEVMERKMYDVHTEITLKNGDDLAQARRGFIGGSGGPAGDGAGRR
jgi:hypothetical protein